MNIQRIYKALPVYNDTSFSRRKETNMESSKTKKNGACNFADILTLELNKIKAK